MINVIAGNFGFCAESVRFATWGEDEDGVSVTTLMLRDHDTSETQAIELRGETAEAVRDSLLAWPLTRTRPTMSGHVPPKKASANGFPVRLAGVTLVGNVRLIGR